MLLTFRWRFDGKTLARFPRLSSALGHLKTGGYIMGILSSTFNKMGHWHIRQLVKDCTKIIIKLSMHEVDQKNNPYLTDSALDLLIEQGQYSTLKGRKFASLKEKFTKCVLIYVVRNLGLYSDFPTSKYVLKPYGYSDQRRVHIVRKFSGI